MHFPQTDPKQEQNKHSISIENDILSYFHAFLDKGYDDLEVLVIDLETITENVLSTELSTEINLLGQRKKVALAVPKSKGKAGD